MGLFFTLTTWLLAAAAAVACVPSTVLLVEVLAAFLHRRTPAPGAGPAPRLVVVIPAHDEEAQIGQTVRAVRADLDQHGRVVVVADNCQDQTAHLAREAGAEVIERRSEHERGKGYAISFAVAHLGGDPPEVVVLLDADCTVAAGGIARLAAAAQQTGAPVQADYLLAAPRDASGLAGISAFAVLVRNRVRPRGLDRLAGACQLTGSGMAFPWQILRDAPAMGENLVEDLGLGLELALRGRTPRLCAEVRVASDLPSGTRAGLRQRRRWEHGQLATMARYVPRLLAVCGRRPRLALLGLALDLLVPPLALLVMVEVGVVAVTGLAAAVGLASSLPLALATGAFLALALAVALAWLGFGRQTLAAGTALMIPLYVLRKVGLYAGLVLKGKQKTWERTERPGDGKGDVSS
jgi:cellulose synthase/poly-beta-1,6-N-acetylglucosamine synthase-like glycosyltransferase